HRPWGPAGRVSCAVGNGPSGGPGSYRPGERPAGGLVAAVASDDGSPSSPDALMATGRATGRRAALRALAGGREAGEHRGRLATGRRPYGQPVLTTTPGRIWVARWPGCSTGRRMNRRASPPPGSTARGCSPWSGATRCARAQMCPQGTQPTELAGGSPGRPQRPAAFVPGGRRPDGGDRPGGAGAGPALRDGGPAGRTGFCACWSTWSTDGRGWLSSPPG